MTLIFDMTAILSNTFTDGHPADDHRVLPGGAAAAINSFVAACRRERAPVAFWTSGTARRRAGAELGEGALVVRGGDTRAEHAGSTAPTGGVGHMPSDHP